MNSATGNSFFMAFSCYWVLTKLWRPDPERSNCWLALCTSRNIKICFSLQGNQIIYAWAMDAPDLALPDGVGFRHVHIFSTISEASKCRRFMYSLFLQGWRGLEHQVPGAAGALCQRRQYSTGRGWQRRLPAVHRRGTAKGMVKISS